MSTAERQADDISAPQFGKMISLLVAAATAETIDLTDTALIPTGEPEEYWLGRYLTIKVDGGACQFALADDAADVLTPGAAGTNPASLDSNDRGVLIDESKAPEVRIPAAGGFHFLQFASSAGCTVTIWVSSPRLDAASARLRGWRIRWRRRWPRCDGR